MTHEMRRATWSGLDGRAVVRRDRRRGDAVSAQPAGEVAIGSAEGEQPPEPSSDPVAD
jgi:hypothetical protein